MKIKLITAHWGYKPGDKKVNSLKSAQKQFLLNNNYAVILNESPKPKSVEHSDEPKTSVQEEYNYGPNPEAAK